MLHRPNPASGTPVYLQLIEQVKHSLLNGALQPGEGLPDVQQIATTLVVNPQSVERAYRQLTTEGVIERHPAGDCVSRTRFQVSASAGLAVRGARPAAPSRYGTELLAAQEVQQHFFPANCSGIRGLDYAGGCRPALAVGGDYYDFIALSDTTAAFAIGDVCGKGVPAALLMATLRAALQAQVRQGGEPCEIVAAVNRLVCGSFTSNRFATLLYGQIDVSAGVVDYVNAGHLPPLVCGAHGAPAQAPPMLTGGPVIGLAPDSQYEQGRVHLGVGDSLIACTDGITEAMNEAGDEWGDTRLAELAAGHPRTPRELIAATFAAVDRFVGDGMQTDDMTLIALRRTAVDGHAASS